MEGLPLGPTFTAWGSLLQAQLQSFPVLDGPASDPCLAPLGIEEPWPPAFRWADEAEAWGKEKWCHPLPVAWRGQLRPPCPIPTGQPLLVGSTARSLALVPPQSWVPTVLLTLISGLSCLAV